LKNKVEIIAEAGINHNGKFNNAIKLIRIAKIAKVNYVKFQLFTTENFINKKFNHHKLNYNKIYKRFKNLEFSVSEWKKIIKFGKQRGIKVFFSIFDISSLKILRKLNVKLVKIPSGEINNYPLLEKINKLRLRVILSTGMSSLKEIDKAVKKLKKCNLSLLHCVSEYPTIYPNLMAIQNLRKKFKKNIGYSDHTKDTVTPALSVIAGAKLLEKHFTYNQKQKVGDHKMSLNPAQLKEMVELIRQAENSLGSGIKKVSSKEKVLQKIARKGVYLKKLKKKNEKVKYSDLSFLRPGIGIPSDKYKLIINKRTKRNISEYKPLNIKMFK
tara:strand:- start:1147 stop:2127 length:981 start_codon:yes stop_codon:yes gene_type:complete